MNLRKAYLIYTTITLLLSLKAYANSFGLGAVIGEPTGISAKMWLDRTSAIDGAFAWSLSGPQAIHIHTDYLIHELGFFSIGKRPLNLFYGAGGRLSSYSGKKSGLGIGARAPLGLSYQFKNPSVELFTEIAAIFELTPSTEFQFGIGIGGRFYF